MKEKEFIEVMHQFLEDWINKVKDTYENIIGPSHLRFVRVGDFIFCELLGAKLLKKNQKTKLEILNANKKNIKKKVEEYSSWNDYIYPSFNISEDPQATVTLQSQNGLHGLCLSTSSVNKILEDKFNFKLKPTISSPSNVEIPLKILPDGNFFLLSDIDLVKIDPPKFFFRSIARGYLVNINADKKDVEQWLKAQHQGVFAGSYLFRSCSREEIFAKELHSLSEQNVLEPILDRFIQEHSDLFAKALGYSLAFPQKKLMWVKRDELDPKESIPDFLLKSKTGDFAILDLKRGVLSQKKVTKGKQGRIRFIAYIAELISQLQAYKKYFKNSENRKWAKEKYGIDVDPDKIKLIGVVGNYENFDRTYVDIALEPYKEILDIMSYYEVVSFLTKRS